MLEPGEVGGNVVSGDPVRGERHGAGDCQPATRSDDHTDGAVRERDLRERGPS